MSDGSQDRAISRRAAVYMDKTLRGARPADLPLQQPTKFKLVINLKPAKALGPTLPPSLLIHTIGPRDYTDMSGSMI